MSRFSSHSLLILCLAAIGSSTFLYSCSAKAPAAAKPVKVAETNQAAQPVKSPPAGPVFERPKNVKGIYVTAYTASGTKRFDKLLDMIAKTELNAVVIDVRDNGQMYWDTHIPLADASHASMHVIRTPSRVMDKLEKLGVYPIARIACFRDAYVPKMMPDRAVQFPNGKPWKDRSGHTWLDPYNKMNWEYLAKTVDFAMDAGFPEIQLDYVRFPSEGSSSNQVFPGKKTYGDPKAKEDDVIPAFAQYIADRVKKRNRVISADIFGIISSAKTDQGIGQMLEKVAAPFDLVCPMVYPSHFAKGEYGIKDPNSSPYAIIKKSLEDYKKRIPKKPVRPWLQDFSLGYHYGPEQIKAEIKATRDAGYDEFLLWNAGNVYTPAALAPKKPLAPGVAGH